MSETVIATRVTITISPLSMDEFTLPDGAYRMSQKNVAEAVGLTCRNASDFLRSKNIKSF